MKKVQFSVDLKNATAKVTKNCDEKYARKLLQDWLKTNTEMGFGWEVVKDFERWDALSYYYFDVRNIFIPGIRDFSAIEKKEINHAN